MRTSCAIAGVVVAAALLVVPQAAARTGSPQAPGSAPPPAPGSSLRLEPIPPAAPGTSPQAVTAEKNGFVWDNRPGIRYGDWFTLDLRALLEGDVRSTDPDLSGSGVTFEWSRRRIGVEGTVTKYVEYEIDYGFDAAGEARAELRDAFVNVRPAVFARVQGGRFKIPFGYERLTGPRNLDFVYRSRVSDALTPGRSVGAMAARPGVRPRAPIRRRPLQRRWGGAPRTRAGGAAPGRAGAAGGPDVGRPRDGGPAAPHLPAGQVQQSGGGRRLHVRHGPGRPEPPAGRNGLRRIVLRSAVLHERAAEAVRPRTQLGDRTGLDRRGVHRRAGRPGRARASGTKDRSTTTCPRSRGAAGTSPARGW